MTPSTILAKLARLVIAMRNGCLMAVAISILSGMSTTVIASVAAINYFPHVSIVNQDGSLIYRANASNEYSFNASFHSLMGTLPATVDIFFGALAPNGSTLSWVNEEDSAKLVWGFQPLLTTVELVGGQDSSISALRGSAIKYRFTGKESKGMYTVFVILAKSDTDPANPDNWVGVAMVPLFVE